MKQLNSEPSQTLSALCPGYLIMVSRAQYLCPASLDVSGCLQAYQIDAYAHASERHLSGAHLGPKESEPYSYLRLGVLCLRPQETADQVIDAIISFQPS